MKVYGIAVICYCAAGQMVYSVRKRCGIQLAKESPVEADIVSTVPDSATPAAIEYARMVSLGLCAVPLTDYRIIFLPFFFYIAGTTIFLFFFLSCRKFRSPYPGKAQRPQEQLYPSLSVRVVFSRVHTTVWVPVFGLGFLTCTQMLMRVTAHRGLCMHRKRV